jgi:hypothetical protein
MSNPNLSVFYSNSQLESNRKRMKAVIIASARAIITAEMKVARSRAKRERLCFFELFTEMCYAL